MHPIVIVLLVLAGIAAILAIANIHIVPQAHAYVLERLGSYKKTWSNGIHFKIPFFDRISKKINLM